MGVGGEKGGSTSELASMPGVDLADCKIPACGGARLGKGTRTSWNWEICYEKRIAFVAGGVRKVDESVLRVEQNLESCGRYESISEA